MGYFHGWKKPLQDTRILKLKFFKIDVQHSLTKRVINQIIDCYPDVIDEGSSLAEISLFLLRHTLTTLPPYSEMPFTGYMYIYNFSRNQEDVSPEGCWHP